MSSLGISRVIRGTNNVILGFHSVVPDGEDGWGGSASYFRDLVAFMAANHEPVDLPAIFGGTEKRVVFTFDDGYAGVYENALPILEEFQVPATVFVNPGFLDGDHLRERYANLKNTDALLSVAEVRELSEHPLITIGNHTRTHHPLDVHSDKEILRDEIIGAKQMLEDRFDITVDRFCYPYGPHTQTAGDIARAAHTYVMSEGRGHVSPSTSPSRLPRVHAERGRANWLWETSDMASWFM